MPAYTPSSNAIKVAAQAAAAASAASAAAADMSATAASASRDASLYGKGIFPTTAAAIGLGVVGNTAITGGSGGTNGTFALAFTGGTGSGAAGRFVVAGGALTQIIITAPGSYTVVPAFSFAASAGLTGTTTVPVLGVNVDVGEYFWSEVTTGVLGLYLVTAGPVATDTGIRGSSSYLLVLANSGISAALVDGYGFASLVANSDGSVSSKVTSSGALSATSAVISGALDVSTVLATTLNGTISAYIDGYGLAAALVTSDGFVSANTPDATGAYPNGHWTGERDILATDGQSLNTGTGGTPLQSTTQRYNSKMLSGGVRTKATTPYTAQTLVPLVEATVSTESETPVSGMADQINDLVAAENGLTYSEHNFELVGMAVGQGSTGISLHASGSTIYNLGMAAVDRVVALSATDGKVVTCRTLGWMQGESDVQAGTSPATYTAAMIALRSAWDTDIKAKTKQTENLQMLSYQTSAHSAYGIATPAIALAQRDAANSDANIHIVCPIYFMDCSDTVHLTGTSYRWLGGYFGLAYKRIIVDQVEWGTVRPLRKIFTTAVPTVCIIEFNVPRGPLVMDTSWVPNPGNNGFQLVDSGGSPLTISSVALIGPTRVKITAASALPAGFKVRYAYGPGGTYGAGRITGPRGNLRDSAGDDLVFDPGGIARPMHNWCEFFEI